jgi:two-component system cell cycle response regulator CtrA
VRQGTTVTNEMLLNHLYGGTDEPELKIIDVFVCKLRKKLGQPTGSKYYIETIWGRGYKLRGPSPMSSRTLVVGVEDRDARDNEAGSRAI